MVDLCETDFKNSATWKSLQESEDSSFSTESENAPGQNNGWTGPKFGKICGIIFLFGGEVSISRILPKYK